MPCGHERTSSNVQRIANRGGCTLSKRSPDQNIYNFSSKERPVSMPALRNSEHRCIILTMVTLDLDSWKFLAPFSLFVQGSERRNHSGSEVHKNLDCLESLTPPPTIIFQVDLPQDQSIIPPERPGTAESFTASNYSGANVSSKSCNRNKRTKSVKNASSSSQASCTVSNNFSGSDCNGLNSVASDVLVSNISQVDKPVKRNSRKKGKKKGKQHKKSMHKKISVVSETQCVESICDASVSETSISSDPASPGEHISQNMSERVISPGLSVRDREKVDSKEINNDYMSNSATPVTCTSYNDEVDESEPIASLPWGFAGEECSCNQLVIDENSNHHATTSSSTKSPETILSTSYENTSNAHLRQNGTCDISSSISYDRYSSSEPNSFPDQLKIDITEYCGDVARQSYIKDDYGCNPSEGGIVLNSVKKDTSFHIITVDSCDKDSEVSTDCSMNSPDWSKDVPDTDSSNERAQCSSQASSSTDFHPVVYGKRGRLCRNMSGNSNGLHRFGSANIHGRAGKDNNHSMWQKVQKNSTEGCICESKNANPVPLNVDISSKVSETLERPDKSVGLKQKGSGKSCRYPCSDEMVAQTAQTDSIEATSKDADSSDLLSNSKSIDGRLKHNLSEKSKSSASKQENHCSVKGVQTGKFNVARPSKIHVQKKEGFEISMQVTHHQRIGSGLASPCSTESVVKQTNKSDYCQSELQQNTQVNTEEATQPENIRGAICDVSKKATQNEIDSLLMASNSLDQTHVKMHSCSGITGSKDSQSMEVETASTHSDNSRLNNMSGPVLQKWVPVGRKDSVVFNMKQIDNLTGTIANESVPDRLKSNNVEVELPSSNSHHLFTLNNVGLPCLSPRSEDMDCQSFAVDEQARKFGCQPCTMEKFSDVLEAKGQSFTDLETDLYKIIQAVDESYKLQTASECIHLVTGSPLAEFERLLHSASPVLGQINCISSCKSCSPNQLIGDALCLHQIPSISLGSLWQWYEKPGSYGLEVKVEDYYNSKRSRNGCSQFHAYFVPYLSAIQLFGRSKSSVCSNGDSNGELMKFCEVGKTSKSSSRLGSLPTSSILLPRPCKEADVCQSKLSSSNKEEVCNKPISSSHLTDEELLFEYFESDQPQQRRSLFEKIKELVRGDTSFNYQIFGNPSMLECLNLHNLHPASWYSVAWYPIYRIPDGNFRAAFLTYHSLGHFVHRRTSSNLGGCVTQIVSPVVGMQSYNAKGECWFEQRGFKSNVVQTEGSMCPNPSEILKERLRALEQGASVMARASVRKGNQKSVNRQPDYEFFLSRRR